MKIQIAFLGGVAKSNNLTGSCYVSTIRTGKKVMNIMVDIGLVQGHQRDFLADNRAILDNLKRLKIGPETIDKLLLTHPHIDHIGRLPFLWKSGFMGSIICTIATKRLLPVMLADSAKIQAIQAMDFSGHNTKKKPGNINLRPISRGKFDKAQKKYRARPAELNDVLYTAAEAAKSTELVKNGGYNYLEWIRLSHNVEAKLYPSGHVMGGAAIVIRIKGETRAFHLCFSGDVGRKDGIILPPPAKILEPIDVLILESTYGGKTHPNREIEIDKLKTLISRAQAENKRLIIPSFSLERSQEIFYLLCKMIQDGEIPPIEIFLDSPLGEKITEQFAKGWEEGMFLDQVDLGFNPFDPTKNKYFKIIGSGEESYALTEKHDACHVIIAGSGMCNAGRVRNHLRANLSDPNTIVCLVGHMVEDTLGRMLKDRQNDLPFSVRMNGENVSVNAEIICFDSFSAHADSADLTEYCLQTLSKDQKSPKQVFLVHGDYTSAMDLKEEIEKALPNKRRKLINISVPRMNEVVNII